MRRNDSVRASLPRASCLPESFRRALVADAREDSPVSDAPVRSVTCTEFVTLLHLRNATVVRENDIGREELKNQRHPYRRESLGRQGM